MGTVRIAEWQRICLAFVAVWLTCAGLSVWSLHAALGSGVVRATAPVPLKAVVITQATPWLMAALLTPAVVWALVRIAGADDRRRPTWPVILFGLSFLAIHLALSPVLTVLMDRGQWTWPRWEGPVARVWITSVTVSLQYSVMAATILVRRSTERARRLEHEAIATAQVTAQLQRDVSDARLQALRHSLQPHFLFNALHSVAALVERSPGEARHALAELGHLLRWSFDHEGRTLVTLGEELAIVERYLNLERMRMGPRLRVSYGVGESALGAPTPPFLLQPLVENAVRHGIAPLEDGGELRLTGRVEAGRVVVHIRNPCGPGKADPSGGLGQSHVADRLRTLFGEDAVFDAARSADHYEVTLRWPMPAREPAV